MLAAPAFQSASPRASAKSARGFLYRLLGFLACAGLLAAVDALGTAIADRAKVGEAAAVVIFLRLVLMALLLLAGGMLLRALWRHPYRTIRHGRGGGAVACCLLLFAFQSLVLATSIFQAPRWAEVRLAASSYDYTLRTDAAQRRVHLHGDIGIGMLARLEAVERELGSIAILEITSPGGLIDEALAIAAFLERRDVQVIAREACDSACVIVAIASPRSYADRSLSYGLHAVGSVVDADDEMARFSRQAAESEARAFLLAHKVPRAIVRKAARTPSDRLFHVPAETFLKAGVIDGLMEGDEVVATAAGDGA
ncbi:MAG TPA: hypothetical protein PKA13_06930 [Geminicoccaceae bacterium]|nr:hypothetical protein [Geminicoccus sp.]HMU49492.1 hypothetical protein [Geminicoccaceae bacterium]